jgi:hypothetical protein
MVTSMTGHLGSNRLYDHICHRYYNYVIRRFIDPFNCDYCQRHKLDGKGYKLLPEHEVKSIPLKECAVDLIGQWKVMVNGECHTFKALINSLSGNDDHHHHLFTIASKYCSFLPNFILFIDFDIALNAQEPQLVHCIFHFLQSSLHQ